MKTFLLSLFLLCGSCSAFEIEVNTGCHAGRCRRPTVVVEERRLCGHYEPVVVLAHYEWRRLGCGIYPVLVPEYTIWVWVRD